MIGGPPRWSARYQGIPFVECGFSFSGCHCWGLVRLVYEHERSIILPAHAAIKATEALKVARAMRTATKSVQWSPVAAGDYRALDVMLLAALNRARGKLKRYRGHVGVLTDARHLLHIEQEIDSQCVPLTDDSISHRILGVYRYHERLR